MSERPKAGDLYVAVDEMPSDGVWGHPFTLNPDTWLVPVEPDAVIEVDGSILADLLGVSGSGTYAVLIRQEDDDEH